MRSIKGIIIGLGVLTLAVGLHAQLAHQKFQELQPIADVSSDAVPDSIVQLTAEAQGLERVALDYLPRYGTFWMVTSNGLTAPYPCLPDDAILPVYSIAAGQYLVDGTEGQLALKKPPTKAQKWQSKSVAIESALATLAGSVVDLISQIQETQLGREKALASGLDSLDAPSAMSANGATQYFLTTADYGTNLWLAQVALANGYLTGIASNTLAGVPYEVQTNADLSTPNWGAFGPFIYGSETTNWTPLDAVAVDRNRTNLFFRLRSWADDGSGLPFWWQQQYFGTAGVDPYGDQDGDGWNNLQELQNGTSPLAFNTPAAPQGVMVSYNANNATATLDWLPAAGNVTGYTVRDSDGHTVNVSANTRTLTVNVTAQPNPDAGGNIPVSYTVQANYAGGNSTVSSSVWLQAATFSGVIVSGAQGIPQLLVSSLPANTTAIRLTEISDYTSMHPAAFVTNLVVPISSFTNNICQLPNVQVAAASVMNPNSEVER